MIESHVLVTRVPDSHSAFLFAFKPLSSERLSFLIECLLVSDDSKPQRTTGGSHIRKIFILSPFTIHSFASDPNWEWTKTYNNVNRIAHRTGAAMGLRRWFWLTRLLHLSRIALAKKSEYEWNEVNVRIPACGSWGWGRMVVICRASRTSYRSL